jgi:hypothetical protein
MALFVTGEGDALVDLFVTRFTSKLFVVMKQNKTKQNKTKQKTVVVMHDVGGLQYPYSGFHPSRA